MNDRTKRVMAGWLRLSEAERAECAREINRVINAPLSQQRSINEELTNTVTKVASGPYGEGCICCGR